MLAIEPPTEPQLQASVFLGDPKSRDRSHGRIRAWADPISPSLNKPSKLYLLRLPSSRNPKTASCPCTYPRNQALFWPRGLQAKGPLVQLVQTWLNFTARSQPYYTTDGSARSESCGRLVKSQGRASPPTKRRFRAQTGCGLWGSLHEKSFLIHRQSFAPENWSSLEKYEYSIDQHGLHLACRSLKDQLAFKNLQLPPPREHLSIPSHRVSSRSIARPHKIQRVAVN